MCKFTSIFVFLDRVVRAGVSGLVFVRADFITRLCSARYPSTLVRIESAGVESVDVNV